MKSGERKMVWRMRMQALLLWYRIWFVVVLVIFLVLTAVGVFDAYSPWVRLLIIVFGTAVSAAVIDVIAYFVPLAFALRKNSGKPDDIDRALMLAKEGRLAEAEACLLRADITHCYKNDSFESFRYSIIRYHTAAFSIYAGLGDTRKAADYYNGMKKYIDELPCSHPLYMSCMHCRCDALVMMGRSEEALQTADEFLKSCPEQELSYCIMKLNALRCLGKRAELEMCISRIGELTDDEDILKKCGRFRGEI